MCRPTTCKKCRKTGWAGCGMHVEQVMADVPASQRCQCTKEPATKKKWFSRS